MTGVESGIPDKIANFQLNTEPGKLKSCPVPDTEFNYFIRYGLVPYTSMIVIDFNRGSSRRAATNKPEALMGQSSNGARHKNFA